MNSPAPSPADPGSAGVGAADRLGIARDQVVQEFGYDTDADYTGVSDIILLWFRQGDGDLVDALVDMVSSIDDGGFVVLLTPKGTPEQVEASEIDEAVVTAGLHAGGTFQVGADWRALKLVAPKAAARR